MPRPKRTKLKFDEESANALLQEIYVDSHNIRAKINRLFLKWEKQIKEKGEFQANLLLPKLKLWIKNLFCYVILKKLFSLKKRMKTLKKVKFQKKIEIILSNKLQCKLIKHNGIS